MSGTDANSPAGAPMRVSDRVAERLMAMIAGGKIAPGQRLPGERQLAEDMGVSRVSVRAALQSLKTQGLLAAVQGGGTRVISGTPTMDPALAGLVRASLENLHDLAEIRGILEAWAARRAAANASPEHVAEMEAIVAAMTADAARGGRHKVDDDIRFHMAVAKASGSAIYMHIVTMIRDILGNMLNYHRYQLFPSPDDDRAILGQHQAVLAAIRAHDQDGAAAAMSRHLGWVIDHYADARRRLSGRDGG